VLAIAVDVRRIAHGQPRLGGGALQVRQEPSVSCEADRLRLERMFVEHRELVWRMLRRRRLTSEAAADATQETFMVAAARLADIRLGCERAFLVRTALRVAHTLARKTHRWQLDDMDQRSQEDEAPKLELADVQLFDLVLSRVRPEHVEVLVLHEIEGFSSPEIAELLQIPLGSVASRLRRGREQFRAGLERLHRNIDHENRR
jgi:RNA polymerase sigma-70 factor, ECF subfamily